MSFKTDRTDNKKGGEVMNWKLRLQNKVTLLSLIASVVTLIYQILAMFDIVPKIGEDTVINIAGMAVNILVMLGIVVDPTTKGVKDSSQAMCYNCPKEEENT